MPVVSNQRTFKCVKIIAVIINALSVIIAYKGIIYRYCLGKKTLITFKLENALKVYNTNFQTFVEMNLINNFDETTSHFDKIKYF